MKELVLALTLVLPTISFAKTVDTSLVHEGKITITSIGDDRNIPAEEAVKIAYPLLVQSNALVRNEVLKAKQQAKQENDANQCGTLENTKIVTLTSWEAGRASHDGEAGGESQLLVIQPVSCDGVGTGLFSGIAANAMISLKVESAISGLLDEKQPKKQVVTVTVQGAAKVALKR